MTPQPTAALAAPCFFLILATSVLSITAEEPVAQETQGRRLKLRPMALAETSEYSSRVDAEGKVDAEQGQEREEASVLAMAKHRDPLPAGWFGAFSEGESTYTTMGDDASRDNPMWETKYGKDPVMEDTQDSDETKAFPARFFHESESGGYIDAWQTHFPTIKGNFAGNRGGQGNSWRNTPMGWRQDYTHTQVNLNKGGPIQAAWFDNQVHQQDGFGRNMQPAEKDGKRYNEDVMWMWKERAINTTITCDEPGCTARASLAVYKGYNGEEATNCRLSFLAHPTDYDDDWSREHLEFIKVNDYIVSRECNPRVRGCNSTAELPLYPCLNGMEIDKLMDENGVIAVEAKNTMMVDECPYEGNGGKNLLAGVVVVNCMVRNKTWHETTPPPTYAAIDPQICEGVVKCSTPGCTGEERVACSPALALNGGTCKMNISVRQTDYDDDLGLPEQIDFFQVEDVNITDAPVQPGKNPCNDQYKDNPLPESELWFDAVTDKDVTELMQISRPLGYVKVVGKNSAQVDECGYKGNILYAKVKILCHAPKNETTGELQFSALPPGGLDELPHVLEVPPPYALVHPDKNKDAVSSFLSKMSLMQQNSTVETNQTEALQDPDEFLQESMSVARSTKLAHSIRRHLTKQSE
jgi:hypothetical protein